MKPPQFEYGELAAYRNIETGHDWIFSIGDKEKIYSEPMLHKVMSDLSAHGWECIFLNDKMTTAFFKKMIFEKASPFFSEEE